MIYIINSKEKTSFLLVRLSSVVMASRLLALLTIFCLSTTGYGESDKFSQSLNQFTVDWLKVLSKSNQENFLISPVAAGSALGIVQLGAKGNSASELEKSLHLNADEAKQGYRTLTEKLKGEREKEGSAELEWGNGGWVANGFEVNQDFKKNVLENYRAEINTNFADNKVAAAHLNEEISNITKGIIKDLFTEDQLKDVVALFYSAIYFKGRWEEPFERSGTRNRKFYVTADNTIDDVEFMDHPTIKVKSGECSHVGAKWVQLPYKDPNYSMIFVLPTERHGLNALIEKMTHADLQKIISHEEVKELRVLVPKFSLSHKESIVGSLKQLGVNDIFSNQADLTGITTTNKLKVSEVVQQVNVDIDEDETRAAAVVGIHAILTSLLVVTKPPPEFKIDEPFLFFIVYKTDKIPLFSGKVVKPKVTYLPSEFEI